MKTKLFLSAVILGTTVIVSCHSEKADSEQTAIEAADTTAAPEKMKKVFYSVPSPLQASMMLKKSGVQFNKSLLNPTKNEAKYTNSYKKAINLGIYGADLAYCNMFSQTQEALNYMGAVNKIASSVGLSNLMEQTGVAYRFQSNLGNKDSLISILAELYRESDEFLKENEQYNVAALSLAGGWVEALYIATEQSKKTANPALRQLIAEQKGSLKNLRNMLPVQSSEAEYAELTKQLDKLVELYANITIEQTLGETTTDEVSKTTVVNGESKISMNDEQLSAIAEQVALIRNSMIN